MIDGIPKKYCFKNIITEHFRLVFDVLFHNLRDCLRLVLLSKDKMAAVYYPGQKNYPGQK